MKKILLALCMPMLFWSCQQTIQQEAIPADEITDGVFIHLSTGADDPHRLLMALSMATKMAEDKDVLVYMDIEAVKVMMQGVEPISMEPFGDHLSLVQNLMSSGVDVLVCPGCLQAFGLNPGDLIEGAQLAEKEKFFGFTKGRILSLDY